MKTLVLFCILIMVGCSTNTVKVGDVTIIRESQLTFSQFSDLQITVIDGKGGKKMLRVEGASSDQVQALEKVAEGVAKGLAEGVKPKP